MDDTTSSRREGAERWSATLEPQLDWWKTWFTGRGLEWPADFAERLDPERPVQERIARHLPGPGTRDITILDVGPGPLSRIGRVYQGTRVRVVGVDPLADQYMELLAEHDLLPSTELVRGEAEDLERLFDRDRFDIVNMENALDHCCDPLAAIRSMLHVAKPGGSVLLLHEENRGEALGYQGHEQWNVTTRGGHLVVWNRDRLIDVTDALKPTSDVEVSHRAEPGYGHAIEAIIRKRAASLARGDADAPRTADVRAAGPSLASLAWTLVQTDFKVRYHGSLGGFVWALLRPLTLFVVLLSVFSLIFSTTRDYALNLVIGVFIWEFFVEASKSGLGSLAAKAQLLTKVKIPAWIIVLTSSANALVTFAIFTIMLLVWFAVAGRPIATLHLLLFMAYMLAFLAIILGFSLASSVLFLEYRDLNQVWDLIVQVGFFVAPIMYPLSILPERVHFYLYLWPPTAIIQFSRSVLVDNALPTGRAHVDLVLEAAVALAVGWLIFRSRVSRAAERL
jgi:homopolymeric O-antigen transport system permease protein